MRQSSLYSLTTQLIRATYVPSIMESTTSRRTGLTMGVLPWEVQDYLEQPLTDTAWGRQIDLSRSQPVNPVVPGPSADRIGGGCERRSDVPQQDTQEELVLDETPLLFRACPGCRDFVKS